MESLNLDFLATIDSEDILCSRLSAVLLRQEDSDGPESNVEGCRNKLGALKEQ